MREMAGAAASATSGTLELTTVVLVRKIDYYVEVKRASYKYL